MNIIETNPCAACTIDQGCCTHLSGLRLTRIEFDRCFKHHTEEILVDREGPLFVVSQRDGAACPNWQDGGCAVYDARPRECALFPHTLYVRSHAADGVSVRVHSDTNCPQKAQLLSSAAEAERMAREFAEEAFGSSTAIRVEHETKRQFLWRRIRNIVSWTLASLRR